jgi:hypothetical protein
MQNAPAFPTMEMYDSSIYCLLLPPTPPPPHPKFIPFFDHFRNKLWSIGRKFTRNFCSLNKHKHLSPQKCFCLVAAQQHHHQQQQPKLETPTPSNFIFPKHVTTAQETFAEGFQRESRKSNSYNNYK